MFSFDFDEFEKKIVNNFLDANYEHYEVFKTKYNSKKYMEILSKDKKNLNLSDICCILKTEKSTFEKVSVNKIELTKCIDEIVRGK